MAEEKPVAEVQAVAEVGFAHQTHVLYFRDVLLEHLPSPYEANDVNRVTLAFFCISALDLLNALDQVRRRSSFSAICDVLHFFQSFLTIPRVALIFFALDCHLSANVMRWCCRRYSMYETFSSARLGIEWISLVSQ